MTVRNKNNLVSPVVKWVGGKRQLLKEIEKYIPGKISSYYEPFIGGGAVLFRLQPGTAVINDTNEELVNLYRVIRDTPGELIEHLKTHRNEESYYYELRSVDRDRELYNRLSDVERASRIIYLNRTCYNGLFRVNRSGEFNTPFGRYIKPNIVNEKKIQAISSYFNTSSIRIMNCDFEEALSGAEPGAFVYLDPPYDPVSASSNFTSYTRGGFGRDEQIRVKAACDRLDAAGVKFLLSNSATGFIRELYTDYNVAIVSAGRAVNSNAEKRGAIDEVLVRNY